jgi:2-polyprenyl-3-methyl-5-hydroxy-6-metoxy-1,4-benzoquinol methylase
MTSRALSYTESKPAGYYDCEREEMLAFIPESAEVILDVGCGSGLFGRLIKNARSVEVWGVETDPQVAGQAATYLDKTLVGAFPDEVSLPQDYFDCVVFNDVLEHMVDPWSALRHAKALLKTDGVVVASLPNVRFLPVLYKLLWRGEWTYTPTGVLDRTHLRFFTKKSLLQMFNEGGYEVLKVQGVNAYPHWAIKLLQILLPRFIRDVKFINYAVVARPLASADR